MIREWSNEEIASGSFKWSLMTDTDRQTMRLVVDTYIVTQLDREIFYFLEIGTYNGSTAWGIKKLTEFRHKQLCYYGIDTMAHDAPMWPEAHMIYGKSREVFHQVPNGFDILFIDGPHDSSNCMLDFLHYSPKVRVGGLVLFHDSSPSSQCKLPFKLQKIEEYQKGGYDIPKQDEFGTAVLTAIEKLGLSNGHRTDYELVSNNWTHEPFGGISIYRKLK